MIDAAAYTNAKVWVDPGGANKSPTVWTSLGLSINGQRKPLGEVLERSRQI